jgi:hypothetical protein
MAVAGAVLCALAAGSYGTLRAAYDPPPAYVNVRWAPAVSDEARQQLEAQYTLTAGEPREGRTWGYYLIDVSRANLRALVLDPAVEDTHQIHRTAFRIWRGAERLPYTGPGAPWIPRLLELLSLVLLAAGVLALGLSVVEPRLPARIRRWLQPVTAIFIEPRPAERSASLARWLQGRVPPASAEAVALFRIAFGLALVTFFVMTPVGSDWIHQDTLGLPGLVGPAMRIFVAAPYVADWIGPWLLCWGVLFVVGAMARVSFAMIAAGAVAWALVHTTKVGAHAVGALMLALLALLWSRWGDAWSVDAWLAGRRGANADEERRAGVNGPAEPASRVYGYTVWVPGLVLGVVFASAAAAKLTDGGLAWILNGSVKYHFLSDSAQAPTDWGLGVGLHPNLAVLLSFGAVALESFVIVGACSGKYSLRLAAGVAAACLFSGFVLFQGVYWYAWWLLLLSFLPWHLVGSRGQSVSVPLRSVASRSWLPLAQAAVALAIVGQQVIAFAGHVELDPFLARYDMYSNTHASPEEYEAGMGMTYWVLATFADGRTGSCRVDRSDVERLSHAASASGEERASIDRLLARCMGSSDPVRRISLEGRRSVIDWDRWRPEGQTRVPLAGPIALGAGPGVAD